MNKLKSTEKYYVAMRPQTNEFHSVHRDGCPFMPDDNKRIFLGNFRSASDAGIAGKSYFEKSCGCRFCITDSVKILEPAVTSSFSFIPSEKQLKGEVLLYLLN